MESSGLNVVTGGLSYIGKYITRRLLDQRQRVLILTGHPNRPNPFGDKVRVTPFDFDNTGALIRNLQGATTLYNTYWVRFDHGQISFAKAVENTRVLIKAAAEAGIRKIVHISVSNPSEDSLFPYFRGKAQLEKAIIDSKLPYAIIRPTLVFGGEEEILVNNVAWLLRRFPIFALPSGRDYRLQPIFVEEVAKEAVDAATNIHNQILDAAGPDIFRFEDLVGLIAKKIRSRPIFFHAGPASALSLLKVVGLMVNDVVLTKDELGALGANLLVSSHPPTGQIRLSDWLDKNGDVLGRCYASELNRHYR